VKVGVLDGRDGAVSTGDKKTLEEEKINSGISLN
jgi:hypothetical protein